MPDQSFRVSPAELDVLRVLWEKRGTTLGEVHKRLADRYAYTTVQTLLDRLVGKGIVDRDRRKRPAVHRAKVTRRKVTMQFLDLLVDRVCDGPAPLVMQLLEGRRFTADELEEIRRLIDAAEPNNSSQPGENSNDDSQ